MSEKLTKAQEVMLRRLAIGPTYTSNRATGRVLVRLGLAKSYLGTFSITDAGRAALQPQEPGRG